MFRKKINLIKKKYYIDDIIRNQNSFIVRQKIARILYTQNIYKNKNLKQIKKKKKMKLIDVFSPRKTKAFFPFDV